MRGRRLLDDPPRPGTTVRGTWSNLWSRSRAAACLAIAATVLLGALALGALWHRGHYGVWPLSDGQPSRLTFCERVYADVGRTKVAPGEALDHVSTFSPLLGDEHDVYAIHRFDPPAPACPMELLMRAGSSYEMYDIEGGP